MAPAAKAAPESTKPTSREIVSNFSPEALSAPFLLRFTAAAIDYILLIVFPAGWLTIGKILADGGLVTVGTPPWIIGIIFFCLNFVVLPVFRGQSLGKWLTGISVVDLEGNPPKLGQMLIRNSVGYLITLLTAGLGFMISALNSSGRALHDLLAGTIVVRGRKTQV